MVCTYDALKGHEHEPVCGKTATRTACHFGTLGPPRCEEHACRACPKIAVSQTPLAPPQVVVVGVPKSGYRHCFYESDVCKNCEEEFGEHLAKYPHPFRGLMGRRKVNKAKVTGEELPDCNAFVFGSTTENGRERGEAK